MIYGIRVISFVLLVFFAGTSFTEEAVKGVPSVMFDTITGKPLYSYAELPDGQIELFPAELSSENLKYEPRYQIRLRPLTKEIAHSYYYQEKKREEAEKLLSKYHYYTLLPNGNPNFYEHSGFDARFGTPLKPLTKEVAEKYVYGESLKPQKQSNENKNTDLEKLMLSFMLSMIAAGVIMLVPNYLTRSKFHFGSVSLCLLLPVFVQCIPAILDWNWFFEIPPFFCYLMLWASSVVWCLTVPTLKTLRQKDYDKLLYQSVYGLVILGSWWACFELIKAKMINWFF